MEFSDYVTKLHACKNIQLEMTLLASFKFRNTYQKVFELISVSQKCLLGTKLNANCFWFRDQQINLNFTRNKVTLEKIERTLKWKTRIRFRTDIVKTLDKSKAFLAKT